MDKVSGHDLKGNMKICCFPNQGRLEEFIGLVKSNYPIKPDPPYFPKPYWPTPIIQRKDGFDQDDTALASMLINLQAEAWIFEFMCYNNYHLSLDIFCLHRDHLAKLTGPFWKKEGNTSLVPESQGLSGSINPPGRSQLSGIPKAMTITPQKPPQEDYWLWDPNKFTPTTPLTDYQLLWRITATGLTAGPTFTFPSQGINHLYKGKMRETIFGISPFSQSFTPQPLTSRTIPEVDDSFLPEEVVNLDTTYIGQAILKDLPPHLPRTTPIPPKITTITIPPQGTITVAAEPTYKDFYLFPSRAPSNHSGSGTPPLSITSPLSRRPPASPGGNPPGTPGGGPPGGPQGGGFPRPPGGPPGPPGGPPGPPGPFGPQNFRIQQPQRPFQISPFHFDRKLKIDLIPEWDGDKSSIMEWIKKVNFLSQRGQYIFEELGQLVPLRLTGTASQWFYSQTKQFKAQIQTDWTHLKLALAQYFMNDHWLHTMKLKAIHMRYQQKDHDQETPEQYFHRKLELLQLVHDLTNPKTIMEIMNGAPREWLPFINTAQMTTT